MTDTNPPLKIAPRRAAAAGRGTPAWIACNGCDNRWTGLSTCHCTSCHRTFTGITAFDRHRLAGRCENPAEHGLVEVKRRYWTGWGWPGDGWEGPEHDWQP